MPRKNKRPKLKKKTINKFKNTSYEYILKGGSFTPPKAVPPENPSWADPRAHQKCPKCKGWISQGQDKSRVCSQLECKFCPICEEKDDFQVAESSPSADISQSENIPQSENTPQSEDTPQSEQKTPQPVISTPEDVSEQKTPQPVISTSEDVSEQKTPQPVISTSEDVSEQKISQPVISTSEDVSKQKISQPVISTSEDVSEQKTSQPVISTSEDVSEQKTPQSEEVVLQSEEKVSTLSDNNCGEHTGNIVNCNKTESCRYVEKSNKWASQGECLLKTHKYFDNLSNDSVYADNEKNEEFLDKLIIKLNYLLNL